MLGNTRPTCHKYGTKFESFQNRCVFRIRKCSRKRFHFISTMYRRGGAASYLAKRYGPSLIKWGYRKFSRSYRRRYSSRQGKPYLRGGRRSKVKANIGRNARRRIGNPVSQHSTAKSRIISNTNQTNRAGKTLHALSLCSIPFGTGRNERARLVANISGFKVCFNVRNNRTQPMYFNLALIHNKQASNVLSVDNFFGTPGSSRGVDFNDALSALDFNTYGINTDKYAILKHMRCTLTPNNNTPQYQTGSGWSWKTVRMYVPLKRQVRWDSELGTLPTQGQVYLVHWASHLNDNAGSAPQSASYSIAEDIRTYFREPVN